MANILNDLFEANDQQEFEFMPVLERIPASRIAPSKLPRTAIEFFAGIGLVRYALERGYWTTLFANDIDEDKAALYKLNFSSDKFLRRDIRLLKTSDLPTASLATASFPCTDLSLAGARQGLNGTQSGTLWNFLRLIDRMGERKPSLLLLENVVGFLSSREGKDFREAIQEINAIGYDCDALLINAVHFVPQSRPRLFLIAAKKGIDFPYETVSDVTSLVPNEGRSDSLVDAIKTNRDLDWKIRQVIPRLPPLKNNLSEVLEKIPLDSPVWWDADRKKKLVAQLSERHATLLKQLSSSERQSYGTAYRRMRPDGIRIELRFDGVAGCLRTPRGGSSRQIVIEAGRNTFRARHMTAREYARLQGVPDSFKIGPDNTSALFGFGDAVCVPAVAWVAKHFINPFTAE